MDSSQIKLRALWNHWSSYSDGGICNFTVKQKSTFRSMKQATNSIYRYCGERYHWGVPHEDDGRESVRWCYWDGDHFKFHRGNDDEGIFSRKIHDFAKMITLFQDVKFLWGLFLVMLTLRLFFGRRDAFSFTIVSWHYWESLSLLRYIISLFCNLGTNDYWIAH